MNARTRIASNYRAERKAARAKHAASDGRSARRSEPKAAPVEHARSEREQMMTVGAILYSSWGYEQTNIDFYEVTRATKCFIELRLVHSKSEAAGWMQNYVVPAKGDFASSEPIMRKVLGTEKSPYVNINSYACAWLWDGAPKLETHYA